MKTITVYIDSDPLTLGPAATQDDLDTYAKNLANHLAKLFPDNTFEVEQRVGGKRTPCPDDDEIDTYVRYLQDSDGWIDVLEGS